MTAVTVATLRLRGPADAARRTQARAEEALRLAAPDDRRLIVVRALDLGRLARDARPAEWQARAERQLDAAIAGAVHGAVPDAHHAGAVWFASAAEARALLLAALAAGGQAPAAWFWRLAVPDWRGAALGAWLPRLMAEAARDPERLVALARAVVAVVEAGRLEALAAALRGAAIPAGWAATPARSTPAGSGAIVGAIAGLSPSMRTSPPARLSPKLWQACLKLAGRDDADGAVVALVARAAVVVTAPELAASPLIAREVESLLREAIAVADPAARPPARPAREPGEVPPAEAALRDAPEAATAAERSAPAREADPRPEPVLERNVEQASAAAGLWLLIRPLARMSLAEWLADRPDLAAAGFARALLRHIAERQRVDPADPLFALLPPPETAPDPVLLTAWRVGLDRWLRWRTRRTLAQVVARRGWLTPHETGLRVRFRADQADVALRLRALDVDPGWVPWLGLAVAYDYRDEPAR